MNKNEEKIARDEDKPKTLIFVDILGFGAITTESQTRVRDYSDGRFSGSSTTLMQAWLNGFDAVLHHCVFQQPDYGCVQAMLFSDCAYLVFEHSLGAALIAANLMRNFILHQVPVRMGIGKGTFYSIELSTSTNVGNAVVSKSRFMGTAVVGAYSAEQCGGKGMRIFLDSSVDKDLQLIGSRIKAIRLPEPLDRVQSELDYLYESQPIAREHEVEDNDRKLFDTIARMNSPQSSQQVHAQYNETLEALNRMRQANSRKLVDLNILEHGEKC
jgi:hypothetical protein